ncbi:hypothetical protein BC941DRAFT_470868 [Chlamydoabsidia padenii]|nr:hypothetical protein BC941DRAFT_470868 [Chlamydoabsidia padenii]
MARRGAPSRRPGHSYQQTRQTHTAPVQQHSPPPPPPVVQNRQPGLFGQMAATAAGVAVGSSVGHAIGSLFTGGRKDDDQQQIQQIQPQQQINQEPVNGSCDKDANAFARCLEDNTNDISACQRYLEQLKSCRQMAQQY